MKNRLNGLTISILSFCILSGLARIANAEDPVQMQRYLRKSTSFKIETLGKEIPLKVYFADEKIASPQQAPVIVYVKGLAAERVGLESDLAILSDYVEQRYIVISVDYGGDARAVSPAIDGDLHAILGVIYGTESNEESPLLGGLGLEPAPARCFFLPAGYRVATDLVFWEVDKHGSHGSMKRVVQAYNEQVVDEKGRHHIPGRSRISSPDDLIERDGSPLDYKLRMDIIYPSQAKKKAPLIFWISTSTIRAPSSSPRGYRPHMTGFPMRGYAYAIIDHCYNPVALRYGHYKGHALSNINGLKAYTAAIRFLRAHADAYNIDSRYIGGWGHSKGAYALTRLSDPNHAERGVERQIAEDEPEGSPEPQPWQGYSSRITAGYQSMGNGTRWSSQYVTEDYVPTIVACGEHDHFNHWLDWPQVLNAYESVDANHVALGMLGLGHELAYGRDEELGVDRYQLVMDFFDRYLKVEEKLAPVVLFTTPRDRAEGVEPSDPIVLQFAPVMDETSIVDGQGVKITRSGDGSAVKGSWSSSRGGARFTFTPEKNLTKGEQYTVLISTHAKNEAGTPMDEARFARFTVGKKAAKWLGLREVNEPAAPGAERVQAIRGATLIDGRGGSPVENSTVVIRGSKIIAAGPGKSTPIPAGAEIFDAEGLTLLPGLLDAHFHIGKGQNTARPPLLLAGGVTSMRDPGRPIPVWDFVKDADVPMPRCFLTGPHFDNEPPAYPHNAIILTDPEETREAVNRFVDQGASAIKIYFRLPLDLIQAACATAHERGVPVTAHLELTRADRAIEAGLNGVEHITSFGTSLAEPEVAARFVAAVQADNAARRPGRHELWATLDLDHSPRVKPLIDLIIAKGVVVSPTLFVMEVREGDNRATEESVRGFQNMLKFTGMCHRAGASIVVGSHGEPPNAYCRELELLVECGLTPMEAILAGTKNNAEFFGAQDRLGAVEAGKLADLILIDGDPLKDISAMRRVRRVMLNGRWVKP